MTPTLGETVNGRKTTRRDEAIRPHVVIYDVNLTLTLPVQVSSASGINAIAHAGQSFSTSKSFHYTDRQNFSRKSVCERDESNHSPFRFRRHPQLSSSTSGDQRRFSIDTSTAEGSIRRVALCHLPRKYHDGLTPQDLPCSWRSTQPPSCRNSYRSPASSFVL